MNYYQALERKKHGKRSGIWDYCCSNNRTGTHPVGYCAGWHENTLEEYEAKFPGHGKMFFQDLEKRRPFKDRYHSDGHKTPEEAVECYRQYEIDLRSSVGTTGRTHEPCLECSTLTNRVLLIRGMVSYYLCSKHDDHAMLLKFHKGAASSASSY